LRVETVPDGIRDYHPEVGAALGDLVRHSVAAAEQPRPTPVRMKEEAPANSGLFNVLHATSLQMTAPAAGDSLARRKPSTATQGRRFIVLERLTEQASGALRQGSVKGASPRFVRYSEAVADSEPQSLRAQRGRVVGKHVVGQRPARR